MGNGASALVNDYSVEKGPIIETKNGKVYGKGFVFHDGRQVNAFLGVPFARNGSYNDRFKKPFPVESWKGTKDCTKFGPRSIQGDLIWDYFLTPVPQSEEDCLNMCIFAPAWQSTEFPNGRPVMVFVHGGGFLIHSAANYGDWNICRNLCFHDVVVCSIQYRLGLLGFLSSGDSKCPGNFGLWDQVAAFKWIRENIANFGGNPNNVTAFGQSAGAASLDLISISPKFDGLFERLILMGGNACGDWALTSPERTLNMATKMARKAGFNGSIDNIDELLGFIKAQPANNFAQNLVGKSAFNRDKSGLDFCPVVDGDLLPAPTNILRQNAKKLCVLIGTTNYEALLFHALGRSQSNLATIEKFINIHIHDKYWDYEKLRKEAMQIYLIDVDLSDRVQVSEAFIRLYSDVLMNNATQKYCEQMVTAGHEVYRYNMTYYNPDSFGFFGYRMPFLGSTHCHDLRYLLGKGLYAKFRPNYDDIHMLDVVTTFWTNFAKYGDPNGPYVDENMTVRKIWHKTTSTDLYSYLELDLESKMKTNYQGRRYEFWKKIEANKKH